MHNQADSVAAFISELERAAGDDAVAVISADLDAFGTYNERAGRAAGDEAIKEWDRTLRGSLPRGAVVARTGGDEYKAAIAGAAAEEALIICEEIRAHYVENVAPGGVGVSFGIASRPPHANDLVELVAAADAALMRAKREGMGSAIYAEEKMVLKSNYYPRAELDRLARLSRATGRTEASVLREALGDILTKYRAEL